MRHAPEQVPKPARTPGRVGTDRNRARPRGRLAARAVRHGVVDYHVTETLRNQLTGLDAVSVLVVAPLAIVTALLVWRDHVAGPPLALGIGAYASYMFVQYILGPEYERLPGDNELLFPLYLFLFALGWIVGLVCGAPAAGPAPDDADGRDVAEAGRSRAELHGRRGACGSGGRLLLASAISDGTSAFPAAFTIGIATARAVSRRGYSVCR